MQKKKRISPKSAKLGEQIASFRFRRKSGENFGSSIVLMSTKFRKQGVGKFRFDDGLTHVKGLGLFQERGTRVCACIIMKPFQN